MEQAIFQDKQFQQKYLLQQRYRPFTYRQLKLYLLFIFSYSVYFDSQTTTRRVEGVKKAIAAGKNIYCEKPTAETLEQALELARLAKDAHVKNGVVQDKLWLPGFQKIKYLIDAGLEQVNMHFMLSKETYPYIDELIYDIKNDPRLAKLNAVVFLSLKQKGRGKSFRGCSVDEFQKVIKKMLENNIPFGFDSCSAIKFLQGVKSIVNEKIYKKYEEMTEPCESFSQSIYINEKGIVYPCSFMEEELWNNGKKKSWDLKSLEIKDDQDFLDKIWNSSEAINFSYNAKVCQSCGQGCQYYNV